MGRKTSLPTSGVCDNQPFLIQSTNPPYFFECLLRWIWLFALNAQPVERYDKQACHTADCMSIAADFVELRHKTCLFFLFFC